MAFDRVLQVTVMIQHSFTGQENKIGTKDVGLFSNLHTSRSLTSLGREECV
jgi:hypothetical protein